VAVRGPGLDAPGAAPFHIPHSSEGFVRSSLGRCNP